MKKLTTFNTQLFIAGAFSIALIATGSMVGTWIGITGLVATSLFLMSVDVHTPDQAAIDQEYHERLIEMEGHHNVASAAGWRRYDSTSDTASLKFLGRMIANIEAIPADARYEYEEKELQRLYEQRRILRKKMEKAEQAQ